jgi:hypothetical protein
VQKCMPAGFSGSEFDPEVPSKSLIYLRSVALTRTGVPPADRGCAFGRGRLWLSQIAIHRLGTVATLEFDQWRYGRGARTTAIRKLQAALKRWWCEKGRYAPTFPRVS